jgi:hypothetical protein
MAIRPSQDATRQAAYLAVMQTSGGKRPSIRRGAQALAEPAGPRRRTHTGSGPHQHRHALHQHRLVPHQHRLAPHQHRLAPHQHRLAPPRR